MSVWGTGILNGMRISMRNMMRGPITVQYPRQKITLPERARWAVQIKVDDQGNHKCTGCLACEKACPDYIIKIDITTDEERNKNIDRWHYEIGACMMCGLCVEACPFDAIEQGHDYELARFSAEELVVDLLTDTPVAKPKRAERPAPAAKPPVASASADTPAPPAAAEEVSADE
jgi:NADH-quinone oxidoreductase chain I